MQEVMTEWRERSETWSTSLDSLEKVHSKQRRHVKIKSRFNSMIFQICGNSQLVNIFIRYPIYDAAPKDLLEMLSKFKPAWDDWRASAERGRCQEAKKKEKREPRTSLVLRQLKKDRQRAKTIDEWLQQVVYFWRDDFMYQIYPRLSQNDLDLWKQYYLGHIQNKIEELEKKQQETLRCAGGGEWIARSMGIARRSSRL